MRGYFVYPVDYFLKWKTIGPSAGHTVDFPRNFSGFRGFLTISTFPRGLRSSIHSLVYRRAACDLTSDFTAGHPRAIAVGFPNGLLSR